MANVAGCSDRTIRNIDTNMRLFGNTRAPANGVGRQRLITLPMLAALCDRIVVLSEGRVSGELIGDEIAENRIIELSYAHNETTGVTA